MTGQAQPTTAPGRRPWRAGGPDRGGAGLGRALALGVDKDTTAARTLLADVSEFQPSVADAAYLAWSKAVVIRAMYGAAHVDKAWYGGARRSDLWDAGAQFAGIYQYVVASQDPADQAKALVDLLGPLRQGGEVVIADLEEGAEGPAALDAWLGPVMDAYPWLERTPVGRAWDYSGLYFAQAHGLAPVWLADYTSAEPATPAHRLWQFTDAYQVPGVGLCDCSLYDGTIAGLRALVTPAAQPQPKPTPGDKTMYVNRQLTPGQVAQASWPAGNVKEIVLVNGSNTAVSVTYRWRHAASWWPELGAATQTATIPAGGVAVLVTSPAANMGDVDAVQVAVSAGPVSMHSIDG